METFGSLLRKKREEKNLSIRQLAKITGVSPAYISQLENNYRNNPTPRVLRALCTGLGIDDERFFNEMKRLNVEELKERDGFETYVSNVVENAERKSGPIIDLYDMFKAEHDIYFKGRKLDSKEKEKVKTMLNLLLE